MISDPVESNAAPPRVPSRLIADDIAEDEGGYDYGWPDANVALADPLFSNLLMDADIDAIGYAVVPGTGGTTTPMILLTGAKEEPLREVFALFARWQAMSGPSAVHVKIVFEGAGYRIAVLPDRRALRWRCCGFGNTSQPETVNLTWEKAIDSRSEFLDSLVKYSRAPFAPVYLGAAITQVDGEGQRYAAELYDVPHLLLPFFEIHRRPEDMPVGSILAEDVAVEHVAVAPRNPWRIAERRAWQLPAIMPKTVHVLRHTEPGRLLVDRLAQEGVARWQVEQAIANLRLGALASTGDAPPQTHWMEVHSLRLGYIELAAQAVDLAAWNTTEILEQIRRDSRFLLRRITNSLVPQTLDACQAALSEAGYV